MAKQILRNELEFVFPLQWWNPERDWAPDAQPK